MRSQYTQTQERASGLGRKSYRPQWRGAIMSALAILGLLLSFIAFPQPVSADPGPPTVNGLFWGDGDHEIYELYAKARFSDSKIYTYVDADTLYVALVVDGNINDNAFDRLMTGGTITQYLDSAGWPGGGNVRSFGHLVNSEYAQFDIEICGLEYKWQQGYAIRDGALDNSKSDWYSDATFNNTAGSPPDGYVSSSSLVWNMNSYAAAETKPFNMNVHGSSYTVWKSPWASANQNDITIIDGWPDGGVISATAPITFSETYQWEWAMVYEWSIPLPEACDEMSLSGVRDWLSITNPTSHHSPSKGPADDQFDPPPTSVALVGIEAPITAQLLPVAGLLASAGAVTATLRPKRRRRH